MMDYLQLSMDIISKATTLLKQEVINKKQCENLLKNLSKGLKTFKSIIVGFDINVFDEAKKELFQIVCKAAMLIEECCKGDWQKVAMMQINNKEAFRELLLDLDCCFNTICGISQCYYPNQNKEIIELKKRISLFSTCFNEVKQDLMALHERLEDVIQQPTCSSKDVELAHYLMGWIRGVQKIERGGFDIIVFPEEYPPVDFGSPPDLLSRISSRSPMFKIKWVGLKSATKVVSIDGDIKDLKKTILKEASILGGLNHPNIIKLFCYGFAKDKKKFEIVMEREEMTLTNFLKDKGLLPKEVALDIMLQIARRMCYMYDMKVAHPDLKPDNVIINVTNVTKVVDIALVHVKLLDFDISKVDVKNTPQVCTSKIIGTLGYMAPECITRNIVGESLPKVDAFKVDVFSFGMMYYEIILGKNPLGNIYHHYDYKKEIESGRMPDLSSSCSQELKSLITNCWILDPSKRPTFHEIYTKLTILKKAMLQDSLEGGDLKDKEYTP